jgi:hypothetical protein
MHVSVSPLFSFFLSFFYISSVVALKRFPLGVGIDVGQNFHALASRVSSQICFTSKLSSGLELFARFSRAVRTDPVFVPLAEVFAQRASHAGE